MNPLSITTLMLALLLGCSKDELTPNAQIEKLLRAQVWELTETKVDGEVSNQYTGLTLAFGSEIYSTTNGGSLWPVAGTWEFIGEKGDKIVRDDGLVIDISTASASTLKISFFWDTTIYDGGRAKSVEGFHEMTFKRKP